MELKRRIGVIFTFLLGALYVGIRSVLGSLADIVRTVAASIARTVVQYRVAEECTCLHA